MENDNSRTKESEKIENKDYEETFKEIDDLEKQLELLNLRKKNIHLVGDKVYGWASRVSTKLEMQSDISKSEKIGLINNNEKKPMNDLF